MLPSRLSLNIGLSPFRNLMTSSAILSPTLTVQCRRHLLGTSILPRPSSSWHATFSTTSCRANSAKTLTGGARTEAAQPSSPTSTPATTLSSNTVLEALEPRLSITFTCTVSDCGERSTHQFTKRAYERGIVLVQCPGCKNRHLIADHLGWFEDDTEHGKLRTVEDFLRVKGEKVRRGRLDAGGVIEYTE